MKKIALVIFIVFLSFGAYCQDNNRIKSNIETIDSIAKTNNILLAKIETNSATDDKDQERTKKGEFVFVGNFLLLRDVYYNMDKLLYFYIKNDYIVFVIQKL